MPHHHRSHRTLAHRPLRRAAAFAGLATVAALLAGCGEVVDTSSTPSTTTAKGGETVTTAPKTAGESASLTIRDAWVKAADTGMSAAFGVLVNSSDDDITVTAATCDASPTMELHETVEDVTGEMIMREKEGGFRIPAGGEYILQPGANHLMLMNMERAVKAGESVKFALVLDDGSTFDFTAPAKDYSGANERYVEDEG